MYVSQKISLSHEYMHILDINKKPENLYQKIIIANLELQYLLNMDYYFDLITQESLCKSELNFTNSKHCEKHQPRNQLISRWGRNICGNKKRNNQRNKTTPPVNKRMKLWNYPLMMLNALLLIYAHPPYADRNPYNHLHIPNTIDLKKHHCSPFSF